MKKFSLITAVLLLSCAWAVAQTSPSSADQSSSQPSTQSPSSTSPSSTSPSSQNPSTTTSPSTTSPTSQQPDTSTTGNATSSGSATSGDKGNAIEGCLSGSAGNFTLTDASGTTYQLAGDTSKLSEHVGHQVRIWGDSGSSASASATGSSTTASTGQNFNVKRVKMVSSSCSNK